MESNQAEQEKGKYNNKNENRPMELSNNMKHNNICIIRILKGEEREKGEENLFEELIAKNITTDTMYSSKETVFRF